MRLIIDNFAGQVEEAVLSKESMVEYKFADPQNASIPKLNCSDVQNIDLYPRGAVATRGGIDKLNNTAWVDSAIIKEYQWQSAGTSPTSFKLVFSCASGDTAAAIAKMAVVGGSATFTNLHIVGAWAPSPSISPSKSPSLSPSASISPSTSPSESPSASPSLSPSASASPSRSPSSSPSASISPSNSPSLSPSASISPSKSPSLSPSASISPSTSPSKSPSASPSLSPSASASPSVSPSPSPSAGADLTGWAPEVSDVIDIASFAGSAIFTYKHNLPLYAYTGGDFYTPVTTTPSGAKCVGAWGNYLFIGNVLDSGGTIRYGSRVQWCQTGNIGNWPVDYYVDLDVDDGDEITGMWILGDNIVVFKKYKTFVGRWVNGTLLFEFKRKDLIGCVGPQATVEVGGQLYYLSHKGIRVFDGFSPSEDISTPIYDSMLDINVDYAYLSDATYSPRFDQIFFSVPHLTSTTKNRVYVFDLTVKAWTRYDFAMSSMLTTRYGELITYFGSYTGYVYQFGDTYTDDDGVAISSYWTSPWIDFGLPDKNKRIVSSTVMLDTVASTAVLHLDIYTDWDDTNPKKSLTCALSGSNTTMEKRLDFTVPCRVFKFKIYTNELNAQFVIHKLIFSILLKGVTLVT